MSVTDLGPRGQAFPSPQRPSQGAGSSPAPSHVEPVSIHRRGLLEPLDAIKMLRDANFLPPSGADAWPGFRPDGVDEVARAIA
ncbi:MAG: hypothetical protein REI45_15275 [Propionicimonas sp.]|nr:hypothetical protein [Propionicimonas sp.]